MTRKFEIHTDTASELVAGDTTTAVLAAALLASITTPHLHQAATDAQDQAHRLRTAASSPGAPGEDFPQLVEAAARYSDVSYALFEEWRARCAAADAENH
jgi:hypothetical protein